MVKLSEADQKIAESVRDAVFFGYRKAQAQMLKSDRRNEFHATDANQECMRKVVYEKSYAYQGIMSSEMGNILYWGQVLHSHSNLGGKAHELHLAYNFEKDISYPWNKETEAYDIPEEDKPMIPYGILQGSADDLIEIEVEGQKVLAIADKKTKDLTAYRMTDAQEHHKTQINEYRVLLNKCLGLDAQWGCNIYIDRAVDKIAVFPYKLEDPVKTLADIIMKGQILKRWYLQGELPPRVYNWACVGYCPYWIKCSGDEK